MIGKLGDKKGDLCDIKEKEERLIPDPGIGIQ